MSNFFLSKKKSMILSVLLSPRKKKKRNIMVDFLQNNRGTVMNTQEKVIKKVYFYYLGCSKSDTHYQVTYY